MEVEHWRHLSHENRQNQTIKVTFSPRCSYSLLKDERAGVDTFGIVTAALNTQSSHGVSGSSAGVPELQGPPAKRPKALRLVIKGKLQDVAQYHS